jgi:hypothetical protein
VDMRTWRRLDSKRLDSCSMSQLVTTSLLEPHAHSRRDAAMLHRRVAVGVAVGGGGGGVLAI